MVTWIGRTLENRYRVLGLVGSGGMGEVYKVEHVRMGKIAAMKILHPELAREAEVVARFHREAKAVSMLSHPHTVQVFDFGEQDGSLFLVMEFIKGRDLGSIARDEVALDYHRAIPILIQMCLALEEAHDVGVIHRDIKPENVLVTRGTDGADYVKVLDFGLALLRESTDQANITARGNVIGTPYYMAPEQVRGEIVDHRVDIYALGATLYRMITGEVPFAAKTPMGVLTKCLTEPLVPPCQRCPERNIPGELEAVIMRAMAKDPSERFQSTRFMRKALESCMRSLSVAPVHVLGMGTGDPWSQSSMPAIKVNTSPFASENNLRREDLDRFERVLRRRRRMGLLVPLILLFLLGGGAAAYFGLRSPAPVRALVREREPNNVMDQANLISRGRTVKGQIGRRLSETQSDVDVFRFRIRGEGAMLLSARLTGIPYINLSLQIFDPEGKEIAAVDNGPARYTEVLPNLVVKPGIYGAVVQEVAGKAPSTNINDFYQLTVDWRPLEAGDEVEPNDGLEQTNRLRVGEVVTGYLSRADDVDVYELAEPPLVPLRIELSGVKGVNHRLRVLGLTSPAVAPRTPAPGGSQGPRGPPPELSTPPTRSVAFVRVADSGGTGEAEDLTVARWPERAGPVLVVVERSPGEGSGAGPLGVDRPYRLRVLRAPGEGAASGGMAGAPLRTGVTPAVGPPRAGAGAPPRRP